MLNHFVQPVSYSTGQPVEGIQPIRGYTPYNQMGSLIPAFDLPEEGKNSDDEEKEYSPEPIEHNSNEIQALPEIFRLAMNVGFQEMIRFFLTPDHDKIFTIQSEIRREQGIHEITIITPTGQIPEEFEKVRKYLYEFQLQLFQTPKGLHCHIIV